MAEGLLDIEVDAAKNDHRSYGGWIVPQAVEDCLPVMTPQMRMSDRHSPGKFREGTQLAILHLEGNTSLERRSANRFRLAAQPREVSRRRIDLLENGNIVGNDIATRALRLEVQSHADAEWRRLVECRLYM